MKPGAAKDPRTRDLARIHLAKKELGLDDEAYRALLKAETGASSSADLDSRGRWKVLMAFSRLGWKGGVAAGADPGKAARKVGRPAPQGGSKEALLAKVEALLTDAGRGWPYANGMAKHMFKVDLVQWCTEDQLRRLVAALVYDQKRRRKAAAAEAR
jgi:phage gp16-like protein